MKIEFGGSMAALAWRGLIMFGMVGALLAVSQANAGIECLRIETVKPNITDYADYVCGAGKDKFRARCNVSVDPMEFGTSRLEIKKAVWMKSGVAEGIFGKFGFIVCERGT